MFIPLVVALQADEQVALIEDQPSTQVVRHAAAVTETVNLAAVERGGIRSTRAYTAPLCGPSRTLIMTGRHAFRTGATNQDRVGQLKPSVETMLPKMLKPAGYFSSAVGKWSQFPIQPSDWGFDDYLRFNGSGVYWNKKARGEPYVVNSNA